MSAPAALAAVAVSVPLPAQRFYGRETELRDALLGWTARVEQVLGAAVVPGGRRTGGYRAG